MFNTVGSIKLRNLGIDNAKTENLGLPFENFTRKLHLLYILKISWDFFCKGDVQQKIRAKAGHSRGD